MLIREGFTRGRFVGCPQLFKCCPVPSIPREEHKGYLYSPIEATSICCYAKKCCKNFVETQLVETVEHKYLCELFAV